MEQFFSTFSARTIWTPELIVVLIIFSFIYLMVTGPWRHKFPGSEPVKVSRKIYFHLGLVCIYLGFGGPLYVLGHLMLSMHMLSMAIIYFIGPPLLLLGTPSWFFRWLGEFKVINRIFVVLGIPVLGLVLFNAMISFYHIPQTFDRFLTNEGWHNVYQLAMFGAALLMWWHVIPRMKTKRELTDVKKMGYMFAGSVLITPACVLIIFAGEPLYETYTNPAVWAMAISYCLPAGADIPYDIFTTGEQSIAMLSPLQDQQLGGVLMKVIQEFAYSAAIGYIFALWMRSDKASTDKLDVELKEYEMVNQKNITEA